MVTCKDCGGLLVSVYGYDGERSFTLYQCDDCGLTGGKASGGGLPDTTWGAFGEKIVADGGRVGEEVCPETTGGNRE